MKTKNDTLKLQAKIFMSPANAKLCIGVPLYGMYKEQLKVRSDHYVMVESIAEKPLAYAIDIDLEDITIMSAEFVEKHLVEIGEL